jgi:hypothetical protein
MRDAGFDVSFRDCPAKGGTGGHPNLLVWPRTVRKIKQSQPEHSSSGGSICSDFIPTKLLRPVRPLT